MFLYTWRGIANTFIYSKPLDFIFYKELFTFPIGRRPLPLTDEEKTLPVSLQWQSVLLYASSFEKITMKGLMGTKMMRSEVVSFRRSLNVKWNQMQFSAWKERQIEKGTTSCSNGVHWRKHIRCNWQVSEHSPLWKKLANTDPNDNIYMQCKSNRKKWKWTHCNLLKLRLIKDFITIVNMFLIWFHFPKHYGSSLKSL